MDDMICDQSAHKAHVHRRDEIFEGNVFDFVNEEITLEGHDKTISRQFVHHPGAVVIVAVREDNGDPEVLLQSQYRHPVRASLWEVPAGLLDHGNEDPLEAAKRELAEEASLEAKRWDVLVDLFSSAGAMNESVRVYLARDLSETTLDFEREDEEADMVGRWIKLDEAISLVMSGHIHNSATVAGLLAAGRAYDGAPLRSPSADWLR